MDNGKAKAKLASPCISLCQIDTEKDLCIGCYRTRGEIAAWPNMPADEQWLLLSTLRVRRSAVTGVQKRSAKWNASKLVYQQKS